MKEQCRISAVSYLNTKPFIYGLNNYQFNFNCILSEDIPAIAAQKLLNNEVDIALVPVAVIPQLDAPKIISPYCIGANGKVATVCLFANVPLEEIDTILLDYQSKTSVQLVKILCRNFWKKDVQFIQATAGFEKKASDKTAVVVIGDRTINLFNQYKYIYDLSEAWKAYTGLPFVFAAWIAKQDINKSIVDELNAAFNLGLEHRSEVVQQYQHTYPNFSVAHYLNQSIQYYLDDDKKVALELFLKYLCEDNRCTIPNIKYMY
ncbi:MAG: menaquinone biosynthesis protein [Chitinophagales bacterium]